MPGAGSEEFATFWYYHVDIKAPMPEWIPITPRSAPRDNARELLQYARDSWGKVKRIRADREYSETFDVSELYHMEQSGDYNVSVWRWVYDKGRARWLIIQSNEIKVTVLLD